MKQSGFLTCSAQCFLLASVGMIVLIMGTKAGATTIVINNIQRYDGVDCNRLMAVYKRTYISVGFKFSGTEMLGTDIVVMSFIFPNPAQPTKPSGGGSFRFYWPKAKELSCEVSNYTMGVLGHYDAYTLEEHIAFQKVILAADGKAERLIMKKLGTPKPSRR